MMCHRIGLSPMRINGLGTASRETSAMRLPSPPHKIITGVSLGSIRGSSVEDWVELVGQPIFRMNGEIQPDIQYQPGVDDDQIAAEVPALEQVGQPRKHGKLKGNQVEREPIHHG